MTNPLRPFVDFDAEVKIAVIGAVTGSRLTRDELTSALEKSLPSTLFFWVPSKVSSFLKNGFLTQDDDGILSWHDWPVDV